MKMFNEKNNQKVGTGEQRKNILDENSSFALREAYKNLRANIRFFLNQDGCKKFCITSSTMGEGKSVTTLNLAISFAENGHKVLLIDADMRRPSMGNLLMRKVSPGLSNVLAGMEDKKNVIHKDVYSNLDVILSGDVPPNPSELLDSERMKSLIDSVSKEYDYILVDVPPVNAVSDARVIANLLDGVLYLVRQKQTELDAVRHGIAQLKLAEARMLGFIINGIDPEESKYCYKEYK